MNEILSAGRDVAFVVLCAAASLYAIVGTVGLFRFPDSYTRLQGSSLAGTTAVFTLFMASLLMAPDIAVAARVALIMGFFLFSSPTTTHIIARYAWFSGIEPWSPRSGT